MINIPAMCMKRMSENPLDLVIATSGTKHNYEVKFLKHRSKTDTNFKWFKNYTLNDGEFILRSDIKNIYPSHSTLIKRLKLDNINVRSKVCKL